MKEYLVNLENKIHKIVKAGKVIGLGEVVVIDGNYGVKVKKVLDN